MSILGSLLPALGFLDAIVQDNTLAREFYDALYPELVGPIAYRNEIVELSGDYLADYVTERVVVDLAPDERAEYEAERAIYRGFVVDHGIRMGGPDGWARFIIESSRSPAGRQAMAAFRRQRQLALCAPAKLDYVEHLLGAR